MGLRSGTRGRLSALWQGAGGTEWSRGPRSSGDPPARAGDGLWGSLRRRVRGALRRPPLVPRHLRWRRARVQRLLCGCGGCSSRGSGWRLFWGACCGWWAELAGSLRQPGGMAGCGCGLGLLVFWAVWSAESLQHESRPWQLLGLGERLPLGRSSWGRHRRGRSSLQRESRPRQLQERIGCSPSQRESRLWQLLGLGWRHRCSGSVKGCWLGLFVG